MFLFFIFSNPQSDGLKPFIFWRLYRYIMMVSIWVDDDGDLGLVSNLPQRYDDSHF